MAQIKLANGTAIKDVKQWDGTKWISRIVKVYPKDGWADCFRPIMFSDDAVQVSGVIRRSSTAVITNDGFSFKTNITFSLEAV